ncbi:MAG: LCP family protein, partial [Candidatus Limnocylindrales bacterium]
MTGSDGRLTVLIAGSDYRPGYTSERTDVIMVVSLDPITHRAAAASIPRDTVHVPIALANGGGNSGTDRINTLLWSYNRPSLPTLADRLTVSLGKFRADVALTLGVEIDYYAYLRFTGFNDLIDAVDGVSLD